MSNTKWKESFFTRKQNEENDYNSSACRHLGHHLLEEVTAGWRWNSQPTFNLIFPERKKSSRQPLP
ncbi:MAG: hypothetical protein AAGC47_04195 [Bacteroidota bacterium]